MERFGFGGGEKFRGAQRRAGNALIPFVIRRYVDLAAVLISTPLSLLRDSNSFTLMFVRLAMLVEGVRLET